MKVAVPRVVGATEVVAVEQLHQAGLVPKIQFQQSSQPKGTVLSQDPQEAANVTHGAKVTLVVAKSAKPETTSAPAPTTTAPAQPTTATVPDVTQQPEAAAVQAFGQAGILASLTFVPSNDVLGTVEAQAKASGASLPFHSHVQINLSTGPGQKQNEQVPNVIGQPLKQALAAINGARLRLLYLRFPVTSQSQAGKIVQQSPLGGGNAPQNAQVLVYLGTLQKQ
jgi:beta-lactam-binding protein with PASTA domain